PARRRSWFSGPRGPRPCPCTPRDAFAASPCRRWTTARRIRSAPGPSPEKTTWLFSRPAFCSRSASRWRRSSSDRWVGSRTRAVTSAQRRFPAPINIGVDHPLYVMMDGDQVGRRIEDLLLRNALPRLYLLIQDLNEAVLLLSRAFRAAKGRVYISGGDGVLGSVDNVRSLFEALRPVRKSLPFTFSTGVGSSVR